MYNWSELEQYIYEQAMIVLVNMVKCEGFCLEDQLLLNLAASLFQPMRYLAELQLLTNLFSMSCAHVDLGAPSLFKGLADSILFKFLE